MSNVTTALAIIAIVISLMGVGVATAALSVSSHAAELVSIELVQSVVLVIFALTAITTDWLRTRIYNATTYPTMVIGLVLAALQNTPGEIFNGGLADHIVAAGGIFALLYPMFRRRWMLGGDLKFLMAIGALMGTWFLLAAFIYGSIIGGALAIGFMLFGLARGRGLLQGVKSYMPYGIALAAGSLVALAAGVPH